MYKQRSRSIVAGLVAVAVVTTTGAGTAAAQSEQAVDVTVHQGTLTDAGAGQVSSSTTQADVVPAPPTAKEPVEQSDAAREAKIDTSLAAKLSTGAPGQRVRVVITFDEDQNVPRMPDPVVGEPRSSFSNAVAQARTEGLVDALKARRAEGYRTIGAEIKRLDADVLDEFWLIKGVAADVPLNAVNALAQRADVRHIELENTGSPPPADLDPANDEADARALMRSDPYFALNQTAGFIGLLDTGVRGSHTLFNNPSHLSIREDLTNPTAPNPDDVCNHGTSSAAIITGNARLGDAFRGVSAIAVDSFKVYQLYPSGCGLNSTAAVKGFQRAVQVLDRVIVAEMQASGTELSAISAAADAAFDAGAVVIAANGNYGPSSGTVNVPAVAQKVLGIGAVDLKSLTTPSYQSRGPAGDGRIKPDLQAPTNVETASSAGTTATRVFGGTSAATPHAAGAAALVRNLLRGGTGNVEPGEVYAYMIMSGTQPPNNINGAGRIKLPDIGTFWRGSTTIGGAQSIDIPISVPSSNRQLNAAIWWPEKPAVHNDADLSLVDPAGNVRASSSSIPAVFERVSVNGPIAGGTWKLRIRGFFAPSSSQRVHFAAGTTTP